MQTTWRVQRVEMTEGKTIAQLVRVEWFKENPAYTAMMDEYDAMVEEHGREETDRILAERDDPFIEQFLDDVQPGDEGADYLDAGDSMTIDVTNGLDLRPGDNVVMTLDALERVAADA
jgi:hypothetical protein